MFDEQKAQAAIDFFQSLKLTKGKFHGYYFDLLDWQEKIVRDVYGTVKLDGNRQYKMAYIEAPKKTGKSEFGAAFALKQLCADNEMMAEVYGCAADRAQASLVFDVAVEMVEQEPELKKRCKPVLSKKRLVYLPTKSFYQVLSSEAYSKHGLNVSACIFDELHAQPNRELWDIMTFGSGDAREQPLYVVITTAGDDPDRMSICWELHEKAEQILLGHRNDPTFYPVIFGIDEENKRIWEGWRYKTFRQAGVKITKGKESEWWKDNRNRKIWAIINPSLGQTIKPEKLDEAFTSVKGNEADERTFKWLRLNIWVKYKSTKWVPYEIWEQNTGIVDRQRLRGRECFGGLDLSSKRDISAYVAVFPPTENDSKYLILPTFWIPEDNVTEFVGAYNLPYRRWIEQGLLKTTPGNKIDYHFIVNDIIEQGKEFQIQEIGFDPFLADMIATDLDEAGLTMLEIPQRFQYMSPAMKETEAFLYGKHFNHGNNPILNWMFGNLEVITNANGDIRPTKGIKRGNSKNKKGTEYYKIDGIVALINAMARVIVRNGPKKSVYEERGVRSG